MTKLKLLILNTINLQCIERTSRQNIKSQQLLFERRYENEFNTKSWDRLMECLDFYALSPIIVYCFTGVKRTTYKKQCSYSAQKNQGENCNLFRANLLSCLNILLFSAVKIRVNMVLHRHSYCCICIATFTLKLSMRYSCNNG